jgi:uncharacterized protein (DUF433 family)
MTLTLKAQPVPVSADSVGRLLIGKTRVPLDTVVFAFDDGATPEEIVHQYPSLQLADVYAVIGYVLQNRTAVDEYMQEQAEKREQLRKENQKRFDHQNIRERLLARRK